MENTQKSQSLAATGIRINVTLPITRFGAGPFSFDPLEHLIGAPIGSLLEPLRVGEIQRVPSATGTAVEVHPLALPEGEGTARRHRISMRAMPAGTGTALPGRREAVIVGAVGGEGASRPQETGPTGPPKVAARDMR